MPTPSRYRTQKQTERIATATGIGYVWQWDSEYRLRVGRRRTRYSPGVIGCIAVLKGNPTGHMRMMVVYPDGSVETKEPGRNGGVTFSRTKLTEALRSIGIAREMRRTNEPLDEDDHFIESQQP